MHNRIVQMVPLNSCSHNELLGVTLIAFISPVVIYNLLVENVRCHKVCILFGSILAFWTCGLEKFLRWYRQLLDHFVEEHKAIETASFL